MKYCRFYFFLFVFLPSLKGQNNSTKQNVDPCSFNLTSPKSYKDCIQPKNNSMGICCYVSFFYNLGKLFAKKHN